MKKRFLLIAALAAILVSCGTAQPVKRTAVEECDIENVVTRKFLKEVDYAADTAYTLSFAREYMQEYGANRTGSLAFLIEALLGVSENDLSKDYELTTFAKTNKRLRNFRATEKETHILYELITHLHKFGDPKTMSINELAYNCATPITSTPSPRRKSNSCVNI